MTDKPKFEVIEGGWQQSDMELAQQMAEYYNKVGPELQRILQNLNSEINLLGTEANTSAAHKDVSLAFFRQNNKFLGLSVIAGMTLHGRETIMFATFLERVTNITRIFNEKINTRSENPIV